MSRALRSWWLLMLVTLMAGCSSWPWRSAVPELPLLPPAALGQQWQVTQSVSMSPLAATALTPAAQHDQVPHTLLAAWSVTPARVDLAGLTLSGQTLLTLSYDGRELRSHRSPLLPAEVSPRDILVQLQLSYWPLDTIHQALSGSPWRMVQEHNLRQLFLHQRLALTIERDPDAALGQSDGGVLESVTLRHHLMHYQLQIQTLTREAIDRVDHPGTSETLK